MKTNNQQKDLKKHYRKELIIKPSITSHLQRLENILGFICILILLKHLKELLSNGNRICCI